MAEPITLTGPSRPPLQPPVKQLIIFLHGYGADGNDLLSLGEIYAESLPGAAFAAQDAPYPGEMGFGRQWFSLPTINLQVLAAGVASAVPILDKYIDQQLRRFSLTERSLALVGFSQGAMMALSTGLRRRQPLAGIVACSGALADPTLPVEIRSRCPVMLVHGDADTTVPFAAMADAAQKLTALGVKTESVRRAGLGHGIDPTGIAAGYRFLQQVFAFPPGQ
jgi:phospholipase/carboxylesterase